MTDALQSSRSVPGAAADVVAPVEGDRTANVRGTVRIAPGVLIELIEMTVRDIEGVAGFRSRPWQKQPHDEPAIGKSYDNGKIAVSVDGDQIAADVSIAITRGTNVTELSREIQRMVGNAVGRMLGLTVRHVNVFIEDVVIGADPG
ncbi:MAG: Asp23/Gls24 family envelope stress response protein [Chloroflexia bacterium]|nr:Asp23/Gls24 family envelope stress response protein [Chloroflexia bacterium]